MKTNATVIAVAAANLIAKQVAAAAEGTALIVKPTDKLEGGVSVRDVLNFLKENGASVANFAPEAKPAAAAKSDSAKVETAEGMTYKQLRECVVVVGRKSVDVERVFTVRATGVRSVELANGEKYPVAQLVKGSKANTLRVLEAEEKPAGGVAPKAEVKAAPVAELKSSEIRGHVLYVEPGKKGLPVKSITFKGEGDAKARYAVLEDGTEIAVAKIQRVRGKLVVADAAPAPAAKAPKAAAKAAAKDKEENTRKPRARREIVDVKASDVRGVTFELVKGSKNKKVTITKISTIDGERCAMTEGGVGLELELIKKIDGVLTYTGTITAEQFRAA